MNLFLFIPRDCVKQEKDDQKKSDTKLSLYFLFTFFLSPPLPPPFFFPFSSFSLFSLFFALWTRSSSIFKEDSAQFESPIDFNLCETL